MSGDINEEDVKRDENEVQDQDQNLRPPIIVLGNNSELLFFLLSKCTNL